MKNYKPKHGDILRVVAENNYIEINHLVMVNEARIDEYNDDKFMVTEPTCCKVCYNRKGCFASLSEFLFFAGDSVELVGNGMEEYKSLFLKAPKGVYSDRYWSVFRDNFNH